MSGRARGVVRGLRTSASDLRSTAKQNKVIAIIAVVVAGLVAGWIVMETYQAISASSHRVSVQHILLHDVHGTAHAEGAAATPAMPLGTATADSTAAPAASPTAEPPDGQTALQTAKAPAAGPARQDAGLAEAQAQAKAGNAAAADDTLHSVITSSGSGYQNFQGRVMYGTYKIVQGMPGGEKLTGFTRILHRTVPDECMDEIPTFHAKPLHPECDGWCDFPVADRPNAVAQWISHVQANPSELKGAWVAILECDYVWMRPLPVPGPASDPSVAGYQFRFGYINPAHPNCAHIIQRLMGSGSPQDVPGSGPAPAVLRFSDLQVVTPLWEKLTADIEDDKEARDVLGWVREMYAWDIALAKAQVPMDTENQGSTRTISQPPNDHSLGKASLFHYTWGAVYNDSTHTVWSWDKRHYTDQKYSLRPEKLPLPPEPFEDRKWHLQDGFPVDVTMHGTLRDMLSQMNKAIETLPDLTEKFEALQAARAQMRR